MKYIQGFNDLCERLSDLNSNRGNYYHARGLNSSANIFKENSITRRTKDKLKDTNKKGISLTRNKNFVYNNYEVVFILDGQKIYNKYKIQPYDYFEYKAARTPSNDKFFIDEYPHKLDEYEEFLLGGDIKPLHKYLKGIMINSKYDIFKTNMQPLDMDSKFLPELKTYLKKYNIKLWNNVGEKLNPRGKFKWVDISNKTQQLFNARDERIKYESDILDMLIDNM